MIDSSLKHTDLVAFNNAAEKAFCDLVCELLDAAGEGLTPQQVYQEAAFELGISPVTATRYLLKHTARRAQFRITQDGLVSCKLHAHPQEHLPQDIVYGVRW